MSDRQLLQLTIPFQSEEQRIELLHSVGALVRRLASPEGADPFDRFAAPEFAHDLVTHMHRAKQKALGGEGA